MKQVIIEPDATITPYHDSNGLRFTWASRRMKAHVHREICLYIRGSWSLFPKQKIGLLSLFPSQHMIRAKFWILKQLGDWSGPYPFRTNREYVFDAGTTKALERVGGNHIAEMTG